MYEYYINHIYIHMYAGKTCAVSITVLGVGGCGLIGLAELGVGDLGEVATASQPFS
jgi:hypothetical protein